MSNLHFGRRARLVPVLVVAALLGAACTSGPIPGLGDGDAVDAPGAGNKKAATDKTTPPAPTTETPADATSPPPPPAPQADQPPTITSVDPQAITIGSAATGVDVTVSGTKFPATAQISLAGDKLPTTFVSPTQLKVHLGPEKLMSAGTLRLLVSTTAGDSNALTFTVANPTSTSIATLTPADVVLGATDPVTLSVTGAGFTAQSIVRFNGASLATTFTSPTQLSAIIPATAFLDAGRVGVTVALGTDVMSLPMPFEIRNPSPTATSAVPASVAAGATAATVTLTGTGYTKGTSVLANGQAVSTTFVSATSVRASVPSNLIAKAGSVALTVQNGTPGGGTSATAVALTVTAAASTADAGTSAGGASKNPDCAYLCADYGYVAGECYADYYCIDSGTYAGCLGQASCSDAPTTDDGSGGGDGSGTSGTGTSGGSSTSAACTYTCTDYGYDPGECSDGWYCWISDGCLTQSVCDDTN
jgi:hypothetical protein